MVCIEIGLALNSCLRLHQVRKRASSMFTRCALLLPVSIGVRVMERVEDTRMSDRLQRSLVFKCDRCLLYPMLMTVSKGYESY